MKKKLWVVIVVVVVLALVAVFLVRVVGRSDVAAVTYEEGVVARGEVVQTVFGSGTAAPSSLHTVRIARAGTVTSVSVKTGDRVSSGDELLRVDGAPLFALGGGAPFYRTLRGGEEGGDVVSLQRLLASLGYYEGEIDGEYGAGTQEAVRDFLEDRGEERTSRVGPDTFQALGDDAFVMEMAVARGDVVAAGQTALYAAGTGPMEATVDINELDVGLVAVGQRVELAVDALPGEAFPGTVKAVPVGLVEQAAAGASSAGLGVTAAGVVNYPVTVQFDQVVPGLKAGMSVSADIVVAEATGALTVPLSALIEQDGVTFVLLPPAEEGVSSASRGSSEAGRAACEPEPVIVEVGLRSDAMAEIRSGLFEGQVIVTRVVVSEEARADSRGGIFPGGAPGGRMREVNENVEDLGGEER